MIQTDGNLGRADGPVALNGGGLQVSGTSSSTRPISLLVSPATIDIAPNAAYTVGGVVGGPAALIKTGDGTLTLTSSNSYAGGTAVLAGTLGVANDASLGAAGTTLLLDRGTLQILSTTSSTRPIVLGASGGTFAPNAGTTFTLASQVDGPGALTQAGPGTTLLAADNSYGGGTMISAGTLSISRDANLGSAAAGVTFGGGTLHVHGRHTVGAIDHGRRCRRHDSAGERVDAVAGRTDLGPGVG